MHAQKFHNRTATLAAVKFCHAAVCWPGFAGFVCPVEPPLFTWTRRAGFYPTLMVSPFLRTHSHTHCRTAGNVKLHDGPKYIISEALLNAYTWQMNLTIRNLQKHDFGSYVCNSVNAMGKQDDRIRINGNFFGNVWEGVWWWWFVCCTFGVCLCVRCAVLRLRRSVDWHCSAANKLHKCAGRCSFVSMLLLWEWRQRTTQTQCKSPPRRRRRQTRCARTHTHTNRSRLVYGRRRRCSMWVNRIASPPQAS